MNTYVKNFAHILIVAAIAAVTVNTAFADDLNPPSYLNDPLSVHAEWQLDPATLQLNLVSFNTVDDSDPLTTLYTLAPSDNVDPTTDPTGIYKAYQLDLPNWVDDLPVKYMRIQVTWANSASAPTIDGLSGIDSSGPVTVNSVFTSPIISGTDPTTLYRYFDYELYPNPDAERWLVVQPDNAQIVQVVADTVSTIPEPATVSLLSLGSLVLFRKRK